MLSSVLLLCVVQSWQGCAVRLPTLSLTAQAHRSSDASIRDRRRLDAMVLVQARWTPVHTPPAERTPEGSWHILPAACTTGALCLWAHRSEQEALHRYLIHIIQGDVP